MDRKTQDYSRSFQGTFGNFRFLEMMDKIAPELSINDIKNAKHIMSYANKLFSSIEYNSRERTFKLWAAEHARVQLLSLVEGKTWDMYEAKTITRNFVSTKHKIIAREINYRPKGFKADSWGLHNNKRKGDKNEQ